MKKLDTEEAKKIRAELKRIPRTNFKGPEVATPWGVMHEINDDFVKEKIKSLKEKYPGYNFRLIECHNESHTYSAITIDKPDPREYGEMAKYGSWDNEGYYTKFKDQKDDNNESYE